MMITGFRDVSDVYRFLRALVLEAEAGLEDGILTYQSEDGEYSIDLEYVCATVTAHSHRLILTLRFLSRGDIFLAFAGSISAEYPHLLMTHLVIGEPHGDLRLRQIRGERITYDRTMPPVVGSAVLQELESEPHPDGTITLHIEDIVRLSESAFMSRLEQLRTPVFSESAE